MSRAQQRAVKKHRRLAREKGLVRVEVKAVATDAALIREVAVLLNSGSRRARALRSLLHRQLRGEKNLLELLSLELPDSVVDEALARPAEDGREVEL
jgi:hypothetical protein